MIENYNNIIDDSIMFCYLIITRATMAVTNLSPLTLFRGSFLPAAEIFCDNSKNNKVIITKLSDN